MWSELYNENNQPTLEEFQDYVQSGLWTKLHNYIENTYSAAPKIEYSKCSMQKGWNIKYKKKGKSICTLYPMEGYFIALVVVGKKEESEAEFLVPSCCSYIQELYKKTSFSCGGRWLMVNVKEEEVLEDTIKFIELRTS